MQKHFSQKIWRLECREGFQKETFQKGYGDVIASFLCKFLVSWKQTAKAHACQHYITRKSHFDKKAPCKTEQNQGGRK